MPSATHQNFVLLFRKHPRLTFELARRAGVPLDDEYSKIDEAAGSTAPPRSRPPPSSFRVDSTPAKRALATLLGWMAANA
jgi:hypothetical protein